MALQPERKRQGPYSKLVLTCKPFFFCGIVLFGIINVSVFMLRPKVCHLLYASTIFPMPFTLSFLLFWLFQGQTKGLQEVNELRELREIKEISDYPIMVESVERIQGNKTLAKLTLSGSQTEHKSVEVLFGRRQRAHIVEHTPLAIVCEVPQSEYEGIGYSTKVRIHVRAEDTSGWYEVPFVNNNDAWWEYKATIPPTRVANVATTVFYKNNDHTLVKVFRLFAARLGRDWRFQFIVHTGVPHFFLDDPLVQEELENGRLEIFERPPLTYKAFARAQLQPEYWEQMHGDRVLVFQADSVPCSGTIYKISDFYNYTYVGGSWCFLDVDGGNSGLSMRNKTAFIDLLKTHKDYIDYALLDPHFFKEDILISLFFPLTCALVFFIVIIIV